MVRALVALVAQIVAVARARRVPLAELAGGVAAIIGFTALFGAGAGWLTVAAVLLLKSLDWQQQDQKARQATE